VLLPQILHHVVQSASTNLSRRNLRRSLKNLETSLWSAECIARAQYRLSKILQQQKRGQEAEEFSSKAYAVLRFWHSKFDIGLDEEDSDALYDHLAPIGSGRSTGKVFVGSLK